MRERERGNYRFDGDLGLWEFIWSKCTVWDLLQIVFKHIQGHVVQG